MSTNKGAHGRAEDVDAIEDARRRLAELQAEREANDAARQAYMDEYRRQLAKSVPSSQRSGRRRRGLGDFR